MFVQNHTCLFTCRLVLWGPGRATVEDVNASWAPLALVRPLQAGKERESAKKKEREKKRKRHARKREREREMVTV